MEQISHAAVSTVNLAEVKSKLVDRGGCLALAIILKAPVYTVDRDWAKLDLGLEIRLVR